MEVQSDGSSTSVLWPVALETNAECCLGYPTPNTLKLHHLLLYLPLQPREAWMMDGLLFHPGVGGPQPEHRNILLFSYLGSQAPTQAAQKNLPAPGQILALVSDGARQQLSKVQALNPWLWAPLAFLFLLPCFFLHRNLAETGNR